MEWDAAAFELEDMKMDGCLTFSFRTSQPTAICIDSDSVVTSMRVEEAYIYQTWDKHGVDKMQHNKEMQTKQKLMEMGEKIWFL